MDKGIIARNFSRCAHLYDVYSDVQRLAAHQLIAQLRGSDFLKILELGCGTGNYTVILRERFKSAGIRAVDISARMLERAKQKLAGADIEFTHADAENIAFTERFDLVTANACFQWLGHPEETIGQYKNLLQPGGQILFSCFGPDTFYELAEALRCVLAGPALPAAGFMSREKLLKLLKSNFQEAEVREELYEESFPCLIGLLAKIKYIGARGTRRNIPANLGRGFLQDLERAYWNKFHRIKATYQIFYCRGIKKA